MFMKIFAKVAKISTSTQLCSLTKTSNYQGFATFNQPLTT